MDIPVDYWKINHRYKKDDIVRIGNLPDYDFLKGFEPPGICSISETRGITSVTIENAGKNYLQGEYRFKKLQLTVKQEIKLDDGTEKNNLTAVALAEIDEEGSITGFNFEDDFFAYKLNGETVSTFVSNGYGYYPNFHIHKIYPLLAEYYLDEETGEWIEFFSENLEPAEITVNMGCATPILFNMSKVESPAAVIDLTGPSSIPLNDVVTLSRGAANYGYVDLKWKAFYPPELTFNDENAPETTFVMPKSNVIVGLEYIKVDPELSVEYYDGSSMNIVEPNLENEIEICGNRSSIFFQVLYPEDWLVDLIDFERWDDIKVELLEDNVLLQEYTGSSLRNVLEHFSDDANNSNLPTFRFGFYKEYQNTYDNKIASFVYETENVYKTNLKLKIIKISTNEYFESRTFSIVDCS